MGLVYPRWNSHAIPARRGTMVFDMLRRTSRTLIAFLFLDSLAIFPPLADQIVLKNGDRVTGAVVKKDGKDLTVKAEQLGDVTIPWDQVTSIKTDKPVNVVLGDGRTAKATLSTMGAMIEIGATPPISVAP